MCIKCLYKSYGRKTTRLNLLPFVHKIQWCFFKHTYNLDSPEESEVENSEKRKGNEHLQEEDLSVKWIGLKWV